MLSDVVYRGPKRVFHLPELFYIINLLRIPPAAETMAQRSGLSEMKIHRFLSGSFMVLQLTVIHTQILTKANRVEKSSSLHLPSKC